MSAKPSDPPRPTDAELEILTVLWSHGASTVRAVHEAIIRRKPTQYTTVLKMLQIMAEKGLVRRDEKQRAHIYDASRPAEWTQRQLAGDLLQRAFGGSAKSLMLGALSSHRASRQELAELRRFLEEYEKGDPMNTLALWVHSATAQAVGWALIHFLWEGAVLAAILATALFVFRPSSARARYAAACFTLLAMPVSFAVTLFILLPSNAAPPTPIHPPAFTGHFAAVPEFQVTAPDPHTWRDFLPWLAPCWFLGVAFSYARGLAGWVAASRLRSRGSCAPPPGWERRLAALCARMRLSRPVELLESCFIDAPVLVGYLRPVILLPLGCLANLPAGQIECILIHELAHIRRHDYLINLLQGFVEGLLFYHPAVWWASRVAREERENCCDDRVVAITGNARVYAATLATLEHRRARSLETAVAATGGNLMKRIRRLLTTPQPERPSATPAFAAGLLLVAFAAALTAWPARTPVQRIPAVALEARMLESLAVEPQWSALSSELDQRQFTSAQRQSTTLLALANPFAQSSAVPLTDKERKAQQNQLRKELAVPYRKWINEDVAYIITDEERAAFVRLQTDDERETFIEQFWKRRDPTPGTVENEFREEHYRRIQYANEHFASGIPGWKTDRGRIYITYGPPDEIEDHPAGGSYQRPAAEGGGTTTTYAFQQWRYRYIAKVGENVIVEFVDTSGKGEFHMTMDPREKEGIAVPNAGQTILEQMGITDKAQRSNNSDGTHLAQPALTETPMARATKVLHSDQDPRVTIATGASAVETGTNSTRAAVSNGTLPAEPFTDYRIAAGDVLGVKIWEDARFGGNYTVRPDGRISIPLLGDITAAGLTPVQLENAVNQAALKYLQVAHAAVQVERVSMRQAIATTAALRSGKLNALVIALGPAAGQYRINAEVVGASGQAVQAVAQGAQATAPGPFFRWVTLPAGSYVMRVTIVDPTGASKTSETPFTVD